MKHLFLSLAVLAISFSAVSASETSDKFAQWVPNFAAQDLNQRKDAQQGWQKLVHGVGSDAALRKEVNKLMVEQLAKENPAETTVWILRQLGFTGDASVVPAIAKFLDDKEPSIKGEAADALANIPAPEAAQALKKSNTDLAKNALISKEYKTKAPAINGETAFPQGIPYASAEKVADWLKNYNNLSDDEKAAALNSLAIRAVQQPQRRGIREKRRLGLRDITIRRATAGSEKDRYVQYAVEGVKSSNANLRDAAILSIASLGSVKEVPLLLEQVFNGENKAVARQALSRLVGNDVDQALLKALDAEKDTDKFTDIASVLNNRYNRKSLTYILNRAKAADTQNRLQLLQLAEPLSSKKNVGDFVETWDLITDKGQKERAEQIIARLADRDAAPVLAKLKNSKSDDALSLLGRISDPKTLAEIQKLPNKTKALTNWANATAADELFAAASESSISEADQIAALRAFVRVISLPNDQLGIKISVPEQTARLKKAFGIAKRDEEKKLIISRAGQVRDVASLHFVGESFDNPELQETVCGAVLDLAHHVGLKRTAADEFNKALDKVLSVTKNNGYKERATRYKTQN